MLVSLNSSEERQLTELEENLIHIRVVQQECQDLVIHSLALIAHKDLLELQLREVKVEETMVQDLHHLVLQEVQEFLLQDLELQDLMRNRYVIIRKTPLEKTVFFILLINFCIKAPVGFEPTIEGFAGPAIRPLWHSAVCKIAY